VVPDEVYAQWDQRARGAGLHADWTKRFAAYKSAFPELAAEFERRIQGDLPANFQAATERALNDAKAAGTVASRKAGQVVLSAFAPDFPELLGGSADLTHSNLTNFKGTLPITRDDAGNTILFGVREFGMSAIANGIALHGGFIPFVATFLVFSDYARNAIRMSALMGQRVVYVFTHDSIALGEDGPTHQPIEHVESLRLIPNLDVWRPADAVETAFAWRAALARKDGPTAIILSRQNLTAQPRDAATEAAIAAGGYVLSQPSAKPAAVLVATGSEVGLATAARDLLAADNVAVRVVSVPCREAFERLPAAGQAQVIDRTVPHVAVEAGVTRGWKGLADAVVGIDRFGESAPEKDLLAHFGFTPQRIADTVKALLAR
jgi:transketolase